MLKLSAAIIAKNEEALLPACLESLKEFDDIVVVDTGSTDRTVEIAKQYGAKVFFFEWCDDFSAARNFASSCCTGDWIVVSDSDWQLLTPYTEVRDKVGVLSQTANITALAIAQYQSGARHNSMLVYKNAPEVRWVGKVHEYLTPAPSYQTGITFNIDSSPTKLKDPERNLRILLSDNHATPRVQFYLGREYYERRQYESAIHWLTQYLTHGQWLPEICEAHLTLARCYWFTSRGDQARTHCLEAIRNNPDFKEALLFYADLHYEPWRSKWKRLAAAATNTDVLFVRAP